MSSRGVTTLVLHTTTDPPDPLGRHTCGVKLNTGTDFFLVLALVFLWLALWLRTSFNGHHWSFHWHRHLIVLILALVLALARASGFIGFIELPGTGILAMTLALILFIDASAHWPLFHSAHWPLFHSAPLGLS